MPSRIFISYAHADDVWRETFERMLAPAVSRGLLEVWSDKAIIAGEDWYQNISAALERSRVGLLLVTSHFLESEFIREEELAKLMDAAKSKGVAIRWVPVSASLVKCTALAALQACCDPYEPLDTLPEADRQAAIQKICLELVQQFGEAPRKVDGRLDALRSAVQAQLAEQYEIDDEISIGRHSIVYRAHHKNTGRRVGVKVLVTTELDDWAREAFRAASERALKLTAPTFLEVLDFSMGSSPEFVVLEYVDGIRLDLRLRRDPNGLPLALAKTILLDLAAALADAHEQGWMRGELVPSDIFVGADGHARLSPLDFSNILRTEALIRGDYLVDHESVTYMTPERYFGHRQSLESDQYSLGLIAVALLGGLKLPAVTRPSDLEGKRALFQSLESGTGDWAKRSTAFTGIVCRMLRTDPEQRWRSMRDVQELIEQIDVPEPAHDQHRKVALASYVRIQAGGPDAEQRFFGRFYANLFAALPDIEGHFAKIDMARQHRMINAAIHALLRFEPDDAKARAQIQGWIGRHAAYGLSEQHLDAFFEAILQTVHDAGETGDATLAAWRETLKPGFGFMSGLVSERAVMRRDQSRLAA